MVGYTQANTSHAATTIPSLQAQDDEVFDEQFYDDVPGWEPQEDDDDDGFMPLAPPTRTMQALAVRLSLTMITTKIHFSGMTTIR